MTGAKEKKPAHPNFDVHFFGQTMKIVGSFHKVNRVPENSINYLALALRARLKGLVTAIIAGAKHRPSAQFDRPASLHPDDQPLDRVQTSRSNRES